ncbi:MAG: FtsQ-type POTRA domain-containing protein [Candidatus Delongbacteria bacterium]
MCARPVSRGRRWLRILLYTLLPPLFVGLSAAAVIWVRTGDTFRLREWKVLGARLSDRQGIVETMDGVRGKPLALVELGALRQRLADDPWITALRVTKKWPDALVVVLAEDEPLAWVLRAGRPRCLTATGRVLDRPRGGTRLDLPVLSGAERDLKGAAARLLEMKTGFPELYARVERLEWGTSPVLHLQGAQPLVLVQATLWRHGLSLLQVVQARRPDLLARPGELDLRFVNQVVWREHA